MHVDVVNSIVRQVGHGDEGLNAMEIGDDLIDFGGSMIWVVCPPRAAAVVFLQDQFRSESCAKSIGHPVAAGVHQVIWHPCGAVDLNPHGFSQNVWNGIVLWPGSVVQPVH